MAKIDESALSKGQLRKLNALRKSIGPVIAERAFSEWLATEAVHIGAKPQVDRVAETIAEAVHAALISNNMTVPQGGYVVKRGRGRIIVERAKANGKADD